MWVFWKGGSPAGWGARLGHPAVGTRAGEKEDRGGGCLQDELLCQQVSHQVGGPQGWGPDRWPGLNASCSHLPAVTLGKLLGPAPQIPHLQNGEIDSTFLRGVLRVKWVSMCEVLSGACHFQYVVVIG